MAGPHSQDHSRDATATAVAVTSLVLSNVVTNRRLPLVAHVPWSLGLTGGLIALARWAGRRPAQIGLDPANVAAGARAGAVGAAAIAAGYGVMAAGGLGDSLLDDARITNLDRREATWHLLMRIPFTTVLAEEIAFRGVLPALVGSPARPAWLPGAVSSSLFGIWHILPSLDGISANGSAHRRGPAVAKDVLATTFAGMLLMGVRSRTRSLAAPMMIHLAANTFGFLLARHKRPDRR